MRGYTLTELAITMVVVSLLTSIALPGFVDTVHKGRRGEAIAALAGVQHAQERWRAGHTAYATSLGELGIAAATPSGRYTLALADATASGYTITATAGGTQVGDRTCRVLRVTRHGAMFRYASFDADGVLDDTPANRCWQR